MLKSKSFIFLVLFGFSITTSLAQIPLTLNYQGFLKTADGNIVPDNTYDITFKLYDSADGGNPVFTESQTVEITGGVIDAVLGKTSLIKFPIARHPLWLGITIGTGDELRPLIELNTVPYSLAALSVYGDENTFPSKGSVVIGRPDGSDKLILRSTSGGIRFPDGSVQKTAFTSEGALALPYSASVNSTETAFKIINTGGGSSINGQFHTGPVAGPYNTGILGTDSSGVTGITSNTFASKYGVYGLHTMSKNIGYLGSSTNGVMGKNNNGNWGSLGSQLYGVYGFSTSGFAGYFNGKVSVTNQIGIGTETPLQKLDVYNGYISLNGPASGSEGIVFYETAVKKWSLVFRNWKDDNLSIRDETINSDIITFRTGTGNVGIGIEQPSEKLQVAGNIDCRKLIIVGGSDFAEPFDLIEEDIRPGMLVSINPDNPGKLEISKNKYDRKIAGVVSGGGGIKPGIVMKQVGTITDGKNPISLSGRAYCYADASYGAIEPGDLLTSSDTPGYAMKVTHYNKAQGAIVGKAMTSLENGKGMILILVTLQ